MTSSRRAVGTVVGTSQPHDAAIGHVTGAITFIDDVPTRHDELVVGLVTSQVARGRIVRIDIDAARALPGVVAILTAHDLPAARHFGPLVRDEPILALDAVHYVGQPVVIVAATSESALRGAMATVHLEIAPTEAVLSINDAIAANAYLSEPHVIRRGDPERAMASAPFQRSGVFHGLGQEHLYFETQAAIAIPGDDGLMQLHVSTQGPSETQHVVADVLGVGLHQVVCTTRRLGGGFGGKETQANLPAACVALVARRTGRAARLVYGRSEDMRNTGKRHPFRGEWTVGFDATARILALQVHLLSDGGAFTDLSPSVMDRAMLHTDNAYFLEHVHIEGRVCYTNHAPATAFRGFGGPQGVAVVEGMLQEIAAVLRHEHGVPITAIDVQRHNLYGIGERDTTPYGQVVSHNHLPDIVDTLRRDCDFDVRLTDIEAANRVGSRWLRGLALCPVKFGISFVATFMNQANALVLVYPDGTMQVSTGGTEMGQGLNTKIRQLVADCFGVSPHTVAMMATSTDKNHNTSPTAASASTDLNGAAAVHASGIIRDRLARWALIQWTASHGAPAVAADEAPTTVVFEDGWVIDRRDDARRMSFADACAGARFDRVDLGARGFYATPGLHFDRSTGRGAPFLYYTQGAAVAEVYIDRRTGEMSVPRVDLRMDIGRSINPGIDRGQIIGGFMQGLGWVTNECVSYDDTGALRSDSLSDYKIPTTTDVPRHFTCVFHDSDGPSETVARSKAVGEPPLLHAIAVWSAVKHALGCVSPAASQRLCLPATGEEILRALTMAHVPLTDGARWAHSAVSWSGQHA